MTEHEKSRKHYEQSGTYDPNMEYFEECEVNSGAWVLITRQIPVDERCKPHLFGIYWGIPKQDRFDRQVCVVHQIIGILLRNGEKVPKSIENQLYKRLDALDAQIFECEMEYKEIVTALTGENRRKEHGNRIQRHGRTEQEQ